MPAENALTQEEIEAVRAKLEELTKKHGSQAAVAHLLGVTQQAVSKGVKKSQIGYTLAKKVAAAFNLSFDAVVKSGEAGDARPLLTAGPQSPRPDFLDLSTPELTELVHDLAVRQLRDVIDRSRNIVSHSIELADAVLALDSRLRRADRPRLESGQKPKKE